jgi:putative peptidoglycan lipid II flippase
VIFGLSGLVMGMLNAHQVFFIPALTPAMYQLGLIFGTLVLAPRMGISGLAWGVLIGAALHLSLQIPSLLKLRGRYSLELGLKLKPVREVIWLMGPRLLGVAVVQLNFWVNTRLASHMGEGRVTALQLGFALMLMPQAAIAQSIAVAAMPVLARQYALGERDELRRSLGASLRGVLLLALPAAVGLILLRTPVVSALYQRGVFTERSTELVAWALAWYAAGLVGHSLVEILARAFYAMHDTRTPVLIGGVAMGLNVAFSLAFASLFARWGWMAHGGLALANSLATALEALCLLVLMRKRLEGLPLSGLAGGFLQASLGTLGMGLVVWGWMSLLPEVPAWLMAGGGVALGGLVYALALLVLRVPEVKALLRGAWRRLLRRSG